MAMALLSLTNKGIASQYASDEGLDEMVGLRSLEHRAEEQQPDRSTSKMLSALFGFSPSTPHPTEIAMVMPHQLPPMYYRRVVATEVWIPLNLNISLGEDGALQARRDIVAVCFSIF